MFDYGEVCPISKAASILCERWTIQIIREMLMGATRFSEFQKFLPKMSPTLLNSRLRNLEGAGIILRKKTHGKSGYEYHLTPAGLALKPLMSEFGKWGMTWSFDSVSEGELNASVIIRDFCTALDIEQFPSGDSIIQFTILNNDSVDKKYILIRDGKSQFCDENIYHEVDIYLTAELKVFYEIWFGEVTVNTARKTEAIKIVGSRPYIQNISSWLRTSQFSRYNSKKDVEANCV